MLAYGEYAPDVPETSPGVSPLIQNAVPVSDPETGVSYRPFPAFEAIPTAEVFPGTPRGSISVVSPDGSGYEVYICTDTTIYRMLSDYSYSSIGTGYSLPSGDEWSILPFGDYLIFTNRADGMLQYNLASPGAVTAIADAPKARFIFTAFDCIFALDCDGENRLMRNSATNDHTVWKPGKNNAGYQVIPEGQELIAGGAISDATAIILQRNSIRVLTRTNNTSLYSMNKLAENVGCVSARSLASIGSELLFLSTDGFYRVNASGVSPIGAQRVNRTFLEQADEGALNTVQASVDPVSKIVTWLAHAAGDSSDSYVLTFGLGYSYQIDKWFRLDFSGETTQSLWGIFQFASPGYSLEDLDAFGTLDSLPYSLDDRAWAGGEPASAGISATGLFGFLNGGNMQAMLWTAVNRTEQATMVKWVTPVDDAGSNGNISVASRNTLTDAAYIASNAVVNSGGRSMIRSKLAKLHQGRRTIDSGAEWTFARGVDFVDASIGGLR